MSFPCAKRLIQKLHWLRLRIFHLDCHHYCAFHANKALRLTQMHRPGFQEVKIMGNSNFPTPTPNTVGALPQQKVSRGQRFLLPQIQVQRRAQRTTACHKTWELGSRATASSLPAAHVALLLPTETQKNTRINCKDHPD